MKKILLFALLTVMLGSCVSTKSMKTELVVDKTTTVKDRLIKSLEEGEWSLDQDEMQYVSSDLEVNEKVYLHHKYFKKLGLYLSLGSLEERYYVMIRGDVTHPNGETSHRWAEIIQFSQKEKEMISEKYDHILADYVYDRKAHVKELRYRIEHASDSGIKVTSPFLVKDRIINSLMDGKWVSKDVLFACRQNNLFKFSDYLLPENISTNAVSCIGFVNKDFEELSLQILLFFKGDQVDVVVDGLLPFRYKGENIYAEWSDFINFSDKEKEILIRYLLPDSKEYLDYENKEFRIQLEEIKYLAPKN